MSECNRDVIGADRSPKMRRLEDVIISRLFYLVCDAGKQPRKLDCGHRPNYTHYAECMADNVYLNLRMMWLHEVHQSFLRRKDDTSFPILTVISLTSDTPVFADAK